MARAKKAKTRTPEPPSLKAVKVVVEPSGDPVYANFAEVSAAQHEFQISFALTPSKPNPEILEQAKAGEIHLEALVQILLPPTIIPGLIKALITTKEQYEAMIGPIKEIGT